MCSSARIRRSAVRGARKGLTERREGMRGEKEIREALKRLRAPEEDATAGQLLSPWAGNYG